jgi:hypothetical protein
LVKYGIMLLENFKIKYGRVCIKIRNNFPHWSFLKFGMEFELKTKELI